MIGRIAPPKDLEAQLDRLVAEGPEGFSLFETKHKALLFAAALGRRRGRSKELDRKGVALRYDVFQRALDDGFVDALAIAVTGDLKVLAAERSDERVRIFEEYANVGLAEMVERCLDAPGDAMEELLAIADEFRQPMPDGFEGMDPATFAQLMGE